MKNTIYITLMFTFLIMVLSCKKEKHEEDKESPVITISAPTEGASPANNIRFEIKGVVTDNDDLHELHITLKDLNSGTEVIHWMPEVHGLKSFNIDTAYTPSVATHTDYQLKVIAHDHHENKSEKTVGIHVMP